MDVLYFDRITVFIGFSYIVLIFEQLELLKDIQDNHECPWSSWVLNVWFVVIFNQREWMWVARLMQVNPSITNMLEIEVLTRIQCFNAHWHSGGSHLNWVFSYASDIALTRKSTEHLRSYIHQKATWTHSHISYCQFPAVYIFFKKFIHNFLYRENIRNFTFTTNFTTAVWT